MSAIRFRRSTFSKSPRDWTPRRVVAARRAVQREHDKTPLFPGLVAFSSVEERQAQVDSDWRSYAAQVRGCDASMWRRARLAICKLTREDRSALLELWALSPQPAEAHRFLSFIRRLQPEVLS